MNQCFLAACFTAASLVAAQTHADIYIGGLYGVSSPSESIFDDDKAIRGGLGFALSETLAVEFNYVDLGRYAMRDAALLNQLEAEIETEASRSAGGLNVDIDSLTLETATTGFELSLLGNYPLNDALSVYGRLGLYKWEAEVKSSFDLYLNGDREFVSYSEAFDDDIDVVVGIGGSYQVTSGFSVSLEWSNYATSDMDNRVIGLSARWHL